MATKAPKQDALDALATGDPKKVMALMLWVTRRNNPDMYVRIDQNDLDTFTACMEYQKMVPDVMVKRPAGLPSQPGIPATHNRRAVPAREALPAKPYVIVALVEKGTENAIRPIESTEEDFEAAQQATKIRTAREHARNLANLIVRQAQAGETSLSDIKDAADALVLLADA